MVCRPGWAISPARIGLTTPARPARLVVRVRNVGKKEVKFSYFNEFFYENPPAVTDGDGKPVPLEGAGLSGRAVLVEGSLPPGKEVNLCELNLELRPASEKDNKRPVWTLFGTGKFHLQCERVGGNIGTGEIKLTPILESSPPGSWSLRSSPAHLPHQPQPRRNDECSGQSARENGCGRSGDGERRRDRAPAAFRVGVTSLGIFPGFDSPGSVAAPESPTHQGAGGSGWRGG